MNVASKALCRKLYKLSGWDSGIDGNHYYIGASPYYFPVYDLGYLMQKLPATLAASLTLAKILNAYDKYQYACYLESGSGASWYDTPEDAACSLAIELFKQGILQ